MDLILSLPLCDGIFVGRILHNSLALHEWMDIVMVSLSKQPYNALPCRCRTPSPVNPYKKYNLTFALSFPPPNLLHCKFVLVYSPPPVLVVLSGQSIQRNITLQCLELLPLSDSFGLLTSYPVGV